MEDRRAGAVQSVEPNDVAFGVHAVVATLICLYQFHLFRARGVAPMTPVHAYLISLFWVLCAYNMVLVLASALPYYIPPNQLSPYYSPTTASTYSLVDYLGYSKAAISFIKYTPQAYLNYQRQSTVGWSIVNILLDFTGGSLSFAQQFIDAWNRQDGGVIWGNVPKLLLALESIGFDILFMVQHYVLYTDRRDPTATGAGGGVQGGSEALLKKGGGGGGDGSNGYEQISSPTNGAHLRHVDEDEKKHVAEVQL